MLLFLTMAPPQILDQIDQFINPLLIIPAVSSQVRGHVEIVDCHLRYWLFDALGFGFRLLRNLDGHLVSGLDVRRGGRWGLHYHLDRHLVAG